MRFESFVDAVITVSDHVENPRAYIENALSPFFSKSYMDEWGDNIVYASEDAAVELTFIDDHLSCWGTVDRF